MKQLALEYITFDQAKKLKELGFPQDNIRFDTYTNLNGGMWVKPSLELAAKWLREEKNIQLTVGFRGNYWYYCIMSGYSYLGIGPDMNSYEESLSAGINRVIEILEENE